MFLNNTLQQRATPMFGSSIPGGFGKPACGCSGTQSQISPLGQLAQMAVLSQMLSLLASVMSMASGNAGAFGGSPMFGQGGQGGSGGSPSPANFLGASPSGGSSGSSGSSGSAPASSMDSVAVGPPQDAGGGWVNPVGGKYRVSSGFGHRKNPTGAGNSNHKGIDLAAPLNTPIRAAKAGTVSISKDERTGYGKWIEIKHADGTKSRYGHLNARGVEVGAKVTAGQVIGKMGSTGNSTGSHLHFEVLNAQGQQMDPTKSMKF